MFAKFGHDGNCAFCGFAFIGPGQGAANALFNRDKNAKLLTLEPHNACFYFCFPPLVRTSWKGCLASTKLSTA